MRKIYIILMHTNTMPSKVIKAVTKANYSHVAISLEKECNVVYSFGRKTVNSILNGGFSVEYKDGEFFNKFNKTKCKIYEIVISDRQYIQICSTLTHMIENKEMYKYDYFCIVPRFLGIPVTKKNCYVCSYFVASLLEMADVYKFEKRTCMIVPKDFENLTCFKEVYNGSYNLYGKTVYC